MGRIRNCAIGNFIVSPPIKAGGGPRKIKSRMTTKIAGNASGGVPVSLGQWSGRGGVAQKTLVGKLIGCAISSSTNYIYVGHFKQWKTYSSINVLSPYFRVIDADFDKEEDRLPIYLALAIGPLNKEIATMITSSGCRAFSQIKVAPESHKEHAKGTIIGARY